MKGSLYFRVPLIGLILCAALTAALLTGCRAAEQAPVAELADVTPEKDNKYSCRFDGVRHYFITDMPDVTEGAPLVLMLHGYGESAEIMRGRVHFEEQANPLGYAVVYVTGAPDPNDPTSAAGWNSGIGAEGNRDTEFLAALARYLLKEYSLDSGRVFAVGFSNGAFMTHRLAMDAGDTFAAVVSVAGMMPQSVWERRAEHSVTGVFQITGEKDDVVPKHSDGSAKYSKVPAIEDVMDYWAAACGAELSGTSETGKGSVLTRYENSDDRLQVWHLLVRNGRHSWPDEKLSGFDTNALILEYLETYK